MSLEAEKQGTDKYRSLVPMGRMLMAVVEPFYT